MPLSLTPARLGILMALGAVFGWSLNLIFSRSLAGVVPPFTLTLLRSTVAMIAFAPFAYKDLLLGLPAIKKRPLFFIFLALMGIGYYNSLVYLAGHTTSVINMGLLALSSPVFTLVLSRIFLREPLTPQRLFGLLTAVLGVMFLITRGDLAQLKELSFHWGDLLMLLASFLFACYSVGFKFMRPGISGKGFLLCMFITSVIFLLPPAAWEYARGMRVHFTPTAITGIVYLGLVASIFCYICWNGAITRIGPGTTALFYYLLPLVSGLEALLLFPDETLRWFHIVSGSLILLGVFVATKPRL